MVKITGGNGSCFEEAIVISDCNHMEGIDCEYHVLSTMFKNYRLIRQSLLQHEDKIFDEMNIEVDDQVFNIYFDITNFYGKQFEF